MMVREQKVFQASSGILLAAFALVPFIGFVAPRFLAYWPSIVGVLSIVFFVAVKRQKPRIDWSLMAFVFMPVFLGAVSLLWAQSFETSFERVQKMGLLLLGSAMMLASLQFYKPANAQIFIKCLSLIVALFSLFIVFELSFNFPFYRLTHDVSDPLGKLLPAKYNRGSIALMFMGAVTCFWALRSKMYLYATLILSSISYLCLFSDSQSLQLAYVVGVLAFLIFPYRTLVGWGAAWFVIAVLTLGAPFISIWMFSYAHDISVNAFMTAASSGPRLEIWDYVSRYALESPWNGFGIEVTRSIEDFDSKEIFQEGTSILHPHNFAVQFWIEFGLFGVVALLAYLGFLFVRLKNNALRSVVGRGYFPVFAMVLSIAATGYGIWQSWWMGMIFLIVAFVQYISLSDKKTVVKKSG